MKCSGDLGAGRWGRWVAPTLTLLLVGCVCGCSQDNGGLAVVGTVPANMATDVSTETAVTAELNMELNETTVTSETFVLRRGDGALGSGAATIAGRTAIWIPEPPLSLMSTYTATLTTDLESVAGSTLEQNHSWGFTTRDGQWGEAVLVEIGNAGSARAPQVAFDSNGNALAVWQQSDGMRDNIWANRFTSSSGWGEPERVEFDDGAARNPQVAFDASGRALAVWRQSDGIRDDIWANWFTWSRGWSDDLELVETDDAGGASSPRVALDANGQALVVWDQWDGSRHNIWANWFQPSSGWGDPELIETDNAGEASSAEVGLDANGNALVVWRQSDGTRTNIWANRFTAGSGWGDAERIETDNAGDALSPQVAVDADGNALAVWHQSDGMRYDIWANRFAMSTGWGTAERIEGDDSADAGGPQVAFDSSGNALAVWHQSDDERANIWVNWFMPSSGWGDAEPIGTADAPDAYGPQIAFDASGNAVAIWRQSDGMRDTVWANRYAPGTGWGDPGRIETDDAGDASGTQVAIDASGNALAVWEQWDGTRTNIWANRFE